MVRAERLWVNGQLLEGGQFQGAAGFARPGREGNAKVALTRDAPVPLQVLNPAFVARQHVFRVPGDPAPGLQQTLLLIEDANEPLARVQVLDGRTAAFMRADSMLNRLLLQNLSMLCQQVEHTLSRLRDGQPCQRASQGSHASIATNGGA